MYVFAYFEGLEKRPILLHPSLEARLKTSFNYELNYLASLCFANPAKSLDTYKVNYDKQKCECAPGSFCLPSDCKCASGYMNFECNSHCECQRPAENEEIKEVCKNRVLSAGIENTLEVRFISEEKGFGLFARDSIAKGSFVIEYIGEILSNKELKERKKSVYEHGQAAYLFTL